MLVQKSFQFRLKLTKKQSRLLDELLAECRWLYNELLSQRILAYEELDISLTKYNQAMLLPQMKEERETLKKVHSQVLQNVVDRLDKSFQNFFRRCKAGEKPGFPRFRGEHRYQSICFPQSGFLLLGKELKISKVGFLRVKMHRAIQGKIKTCTLRKLPTGEWNVSFSCEVEVSPKPKLGSSVGIDMGIENFATLSNGEVVNNPRCFKKGEKALAKAQRKLSSLKKGTSERKKQGKATAKIHQKIKNQRQNFCHQESRKIIDRYQYICIENLEVKNMIQGSSFAKSISDASWSQFRQFLTYKAAEAGRHLELVNPAYTTQDCFKCGFREEKTLSERRHVCKNCGYSTSRDLNAAQNILALGLDGLGTLPRSPRLLSVGAVT